MLRYVNQLKNSIAKASVEETPPRLLVFAIDRDYSEIFKYAEDAIVFVDSYKVAWKAFFHQVVVSHMDMIIDILNQLPTSFVKNIVVDSTDSIPGNLHEVFSKCVEKKSNLLIVAGITQKGSFFNFGHFIEARADLVWVEKAYRKRTVKSDENSIYNAASERASGMCEVCGKSCGDLQLHHVLSGKGRRKQQERLETVRMLCYDCHQGDHGVHGKYGSDLDLRLKREIQEYYISQNLSEEEIRILMGGRLY